MVFTWLNRAVYLEYGIMGCERHDIGARDNGPAGMVHLDADVLDELHGSPLQKPVRPHL